MLSSSALKRVAAARDAATVQSDHEDCPSDPEVCEDGKADSEIVLCDLVPRSNKGSMTQLNVSEASSVRFEDRYWFTRVEMMNALLATTMLTQASSMYLEAKEVQHT